LTTFCIEKDLKGVQDGPAYRSDIYKRLEFSVVIVALRIIVVGIALQDERFFVPFSYWHKPALISGI
jgi:hypothetical protein